MKNRVRKTGLLLGLPPRHLRLLRRIGRLADERGVSVYLVGGVVRDLLLKRENWDLDLTVEGDGIAFARHVAAHYEASLVLFERFATARLTLPGGVKIDIATTRHESYAQPAALPDVKPASLTEDLYRRDFTINAMAVRLNASQFGQLHDLYNGQHDLKAKIIRVLHERSFHDDPTRIFRAVRFAQRFGFRIEPHTAELLQEAASTNRIAQLSGPRLCHEIMLLCSESKPHPSFQWLERLKLLRFLHPNLRYPGSTKQIVQSLPKAVAWWMRCCSHHPLDRPLAYLMAVLGVSEPSVVEAVVARLMLSNEQARKVRASGNRLKVIAHKLGEASRLRPSEIYRLLHGLPDEALVLCAAMIGTRTASLGRIKRRLREFVRNARAATPVLRGDDLVKMGVPVGPQVGEMLARLLEASLDGKVKGKTGERAFVRARLLRTP